MLSVLTTKLKLVCIDIVNKFIVTLGMNGATFLLNLK
jgi:hypothetical protein